MYLREERRKKKELEIGLPIHRRLGTPGIRSNACHAYDCRVRRLSDRQKLLSMIRNVVGIEGRFAQRLFLAKFFDDNEGNNSIRFIKILEIIILDRNVSIFTPKTYRLRSRFRMFK